MSLGEQPESSEEQIRGMRFYSIDVVIDYLHSLGVDTRDTGFTRDTTGNLSLLGNPITEIDETTGKVKFTEHGVNATTGFIEDNS